MPATPSKDFSALIYRAPAFDALGRTPARRRSASWLPFVAIAALVTLLAVEASGSVASRPRWFLEALFECISALATVGLSTGITPALSDPGKLVLIALMFVGRLGPITAAVALARHEHVYQPEYPEEEPLIG